MAQVKCDGLSQGLARMFANPSLMNGEDAALYHELYGLVEEAAQPRDIWEHMMVFDVVSHFWEQLRFRRCNGTIINAKRRIALEQVLRTAVGFSAQDAKSAADFYFGISRNFTEYDPERSYRVPRSRDEVIACLTERGMTEADIDSVALELSADVLFDLERLAFRHELRREAILKELDRRREQRALQRVAGGTAPQTGRGGPLVGASPIEFPAASPGQVPPPPLPLPLPQQAVKPPPVILPPPV